MNGYKIVLLKAILCFIGCRKVNGYAPEYVALAIAMKIIPKTHQKIGPKIVTPLLPVECAMREPTRLKQPKINAIQPNVFISELFIKK